MTFKPATCPNCAAALQIPDDRATVSCMFCGGTIIVQEALQTAAAGNVANWLKLASTASKAGNYSEAFDYYTRILEVNSGHCEAWFGKGESAGRLSTPQSYRMPEMLTGFQTAIEHAPAEKQPDLRARAVASTKTITRWCYQSSLNNLTHYITDDEAWQAHLRQSWDILYALEAAHVYAPNDRQIIEGIISICNDLLHGFSYTDPRVTDQKLRARLQWRQVSGGYAESIRNKRELFAAKMRALNPPRRPAAPPQSNALILPSLPWRYILIGAVVLFGAFGLMLIAVAMFQPPPRRPTQPTSQALAAPTLPKERVDNGERLYKRMRGAPKPGLSNFSAPMIRLVVPRREWSSLSKNEQIDVTFYAESLVRRAKESPADYIDIPPSAPLYKSALDHARNMCSDCWEVIAGDLKNGTVSTDSIVVQGDAPWEGVDPCCRGEKASRFRSEK